MTARNEVFFVQNDKERLDKFLTVCLTDLSRSRLQGLIKNGAVRVNGDLAEKTGLSLNRGDRVEISIPPTKPSTLVGEDIPLAVIFENRDLMIVNKPAGMVVHPSPGHSTGTLVHAALGHAPEMEGIGGEERPGIVHRLDKGTSGLIVIAKNEQSHRFLQDQFKARTVEKIYLGLVDGRPPTPSGRIEAAIGRNTSHRKLMAIVPLEKGREAISEYRIIEQFHQHTLLEVHPLTGRTHQIRLHLAFLGCPIVGDTVYGRRKPSISLERHFLHAYRLKIRLPMEKSARIFEAPLPSELSAILEFLRKE